MDEQRFQAYVALIEQLMWCDGEEALAVLQQQEQLVDAGLLEVMAVEIERLQRQGNAKAAKRLRQIAADLTKKNQMVVEAAPSQETAITESSGNSEQFLWAVLLLVAESQGDAQQVYSFLTQNQYQLNETLLQTLPRVAAEFLGSNPKSVAIVLVEFGNLINQFSLGERWLNLELGIEAYQQALTVQTKTDMPGVWALTINNLANAFSDRIQGDRSDNIEQAINYCQQALMVRTKAAMPVDWATTITNLANAYYFRIQGNRADNIEQAISYYQQALTVRTKTAMSVDWAITMTNLATAYYSHIRGDRAENTEQAISYYQQVLTVATQTAMPIHWARAMNNLAIAYFDRIKGDRVENIEQAIDAYQKALTVRTKTAMPVSWAQTLMNLANAYSGRILGKRAKNIEQAISYYQQVLTVRTKTAMPISWAITMTNLANAYYFRVQGDRAENIEQAIDAYRKTLTVRTRTAMPIDWAITMNNLATAYSDRIKGDRAENIEQAIDAFQSSLEIYDPELFSNDCRRTAHKLGNLYSEQNRWAEAVPIYQKALQAAETLYQSANLLDGKAAELSETADLPRRAAYALAQSGDLQKAIETLEQGRARGLSETLDRDRSNLSQLQQTYPELVAQYQEITAQLRNLESQQRERMTSAERHSITPEVLRDQAQQLRQKLTATIEQIRQIEGYADFLAQPDFSDIQQAVRSDVPLVYLVPTPAGSFALIVTSNGTVDLWLNDLTDSNLIDLLSNWFNAYNQSRTNHQVLLDAIDQVTRQLWEPLMAPLIDHLKQHSFQQATLIPSGYLSLLPLHAALGQKTPAHPPADAMP